jgi:hypothetical protein
VARTATETGLRFLDRFDREGSAADGLRAYHFASVAKALLELAEEKEHANRH